MLSSGKPVGIKLCIGQKEEFAALVHAMIREDCYPDFVTVREGGWHGAVPNFGPEAVCCLQGGRSRRRDGRGTSGIQQLHRNAPQVPRRPLRLAGFRSLDLTTNALSPPALSSALRGLGKWILVNALHGTAFQPPIGPPFLLGPANEFLGRGSRAPATRTGKFPRGMLLTSLVLLTRDALAFVEDILTAAGIRSKVPIPSQRGPAALIEVSSHPAELPALLSSPESPCFRWRL